MGLSEEELAAIEKACTKATPGPWTYAPDDGTIWPPSGGDANFVGRFHCGRDDGGNNARPLIADAMVIVGAREWLPALLAEVRRLRQARQNLEESLALGEERWASYYKDIEETNAALDAAGLHVGSSDLSTLVGILIKDADNGREALRAEREACAKLALVERDSAYANGFHSKAEVADIIAAAIRARGE